METFKLGEREVILKELKYKDIIAVADLSQVEAAKKILLSATDLTEAEYDELSMKDGIALQTKVNELNDLVDFQKPLNG